MDAVSVFAPGPLPVIKAVGDECGLVEVLDEQLPQKSNLRGVALYHGMVRITERIDDRVSDRQRWVGRRTGERAMTLGRRTSRSTVVLVIVGLVLGAAVAPFVTSFATVPISGTVAVIPIERVLDGLTSLPSRAAPGVGQRVDDLGVGGELERVEEPGPLVGRRAHAASPPGTAASSLCLADRSVLED